MADIAQPLIVEALTRAAAAPEGLPLIASKAGAGLFAGTAAGKQAAQACKDAGLLDVLRREPRGKTTLEVVGLTDRGLALLLDRANPKPVLEALVQALQARRDQLQAIAGDVQRSQQQLAALEAVARRVLDQLHLQQHVPPAAPWEKNGKHAPPDLAASIRAELERWYAADALGDLPLPELFRRLRPTFPQLTVGQFHDELRLLHQGQHVYLHPWTGPLYELPEPAFALLVGHEIAYYASHR